MEDEGLLGWGGECVHWHGCFMMWRAFLLQSGALFPPHGMPRCLACETWRDHDKHVLANSLSFPPMPQAMGTSLRPSRSRRSTRWRSELNTLRAHVATRLAGTGHKFSLQNSCPVCSSMPRALDLACCFWCVTSLGQIPGQVRCSSRDSQRGAFVPGGSCGDSDIKHASVQC